MEIILIAVLFLHFVGDFVCQPYWLKIAKTRHLDALFLHIGIYFFVMVFGLSFLVGIREAFYYSLINALAHFIIDAVTATIISSRSTKLKLDPDVRRPMFERVNLYFPIMFLGLDQLLHQACLMATIFLLLV